MLISIKRLHWALIMALLAVTLGEKGAGLEPESIKWILAFLATYVGAQGAADFGKEKAALEVEKAKLENKATAKKKTAKKAPAK